ncbi:MAG: hypothetical protein MRJ66_16565 [Nitrospira sp.]|nr:hypothetical protein [Nitrospira sp.]
MTHAVHPEPQETRDWCWAATSKSVMAYYNEKIGKETHSQCQVVSHSINFGVSEADCCPSESASAKPECMGGGWPSNALGRHGFDYQVVQEPIDNWKVLTTEICENGPFLYITELRGGGKHALVAAGYGMSSGQQFVLIHDPTQEDFKYIPYEEFLGNVRDPDGSSPHSIDRNYVQISQIVEDQP